MSGTMFGRVTQIPCRVSLRNFIRVSVCPFDRQMRYRPHYSPPIACSATAAMSRTERRSVHPQADSILSFWLGDDYATLPRNKLAKTAKKWFSADPQLDQEMRERFLPDLEAAAEGRFDAWQSGYEGLAAVILMDQFSRNVFRGMPDMYRLDGKALKVLQGMVDDEGHVLALKASGESRSFIPSHRSVLLMPYMHAEDVHVQENGLPEFEHLVEECEGLADADDLKGYVKRELTAAIKHLEVVRRWGRYPHRNLLLGRPSTPEEEEGLRERTIPKF